MRFRLLGPLRVWSGDAWSQVSAAQQRAVLAVLLVEAGQVVTVDRLVDEIWGSSPPRTAANTIQAYVSRLRRILDSGSAETLLTCGGGYEIVVADGDLDTKAFRRLAVSARRNLAEGRLAVAVAELSEGLALWRGPAFADVPATRTVEAEVARLDRLRLTALEDRIGAQLGLGSPGDVVDELYGLVGEHPLREHLWALLMRALLQCGRRPEALEAYGCARRLLVEECGLEPGPQLQTLQRSALADEAAEPLATQRGTVVASRPGRIRPAQLPADVAGFTGRAEHLRRLDMLLPGTDQPQTALVLATIVGPAGVGKTALAVHWAHRVRNRFPDGQLWVNLHGYAAGRPTRPVEALAGFLQALGVAPEDVPAREDDAADLYRSAMAGKQMLVLLDNAHHPDQVRPLLPGSPGCLVLVTSRDKLRGLVAADGAATLSLDAFTANESGALLSRLLGVRRIREEPQAAARLAGLCGHLPLALRIAAADLVTSRQTVAGYAARLATGDRLKALQVDGDPHATVRAAFDLSYMAQPADAKRLFRLLGLVPGPDFTAPATAALADVSTGDAASILDRLANAHLIDEHGAGRYACHDLMRAYAAGLAAAEETDADREAAAGRLFDHYLRTVAAAAQRLYPEVLRLPQPTADRSPRPAFGDHVEASTWLDAERANLIAAITYTSEHGPREVAWR
ncbi:MAG TPA: BTAD domain-containing putative transcriptional regulator, partial [Kribbellaceae bacterium]|nr:BTAD domain-containing putative transcriptional regulator [Kribbellaceae bacterium]